MTSVLYDAPGPRARKFSRLVSAGIALALILLVGSGFYNLSSQGLFDADRWDIFNDPLVWLDLLGALGTTLQMAGLGAIGAILLGMVLALLRIAPSRWIRVPTTGALELLRGLPVLLMMFFFWAFAGFDPFWAVVTALALYNGAIIGEALRAGIVSLPKGQREAGLSVGLGGLQTRLLIEFPQAFRNMIPIIVAQVVVLLKDTSLGYIIGMQEFLRRGRLTAEFFGAGQYAFSVFVVMIAMYLAVNLTVSWIARRLAKGGSRKPRKAAPPTGGGPSAIDPAFGSARIGGSAGTGSTNT